MLTTMIRTLILYALLVIIMRVMGKRQIGELQPGELVITILISEIAAIPMQDNDIPMLNSVISVLLLAAFEIIISVVSMKNVKFRSLLQGNPIIIIRDGILDQKEMKRLRYTVDDLLEALRQKDVFDINEVQYAIVETDGTLSVLLKPDKRELTIGDTNLKYDSLSFHHIIISDGKILESEIQNCNMTKDKITAILTEKGLTEKDVLLLSADRNGNINLIKKEKKR